MSGNGGLGAGARPTAPLRHMIPSSNSGRLSLFAHLFALAIGRETKDVRRTFVISELATQRLSHPPYPVIDQTGNYTSDQNHALKASGYFSRIKTGMMISVGTLSTIVTVRKILQESWNIEDNAEAAIDWVEKQTRSHN
ncbi:hypothetical protein B0H63DRAFT_517530 [Podospora didyma]|uniref:Uncharacterized protein n=1 Tax=Podospora didyma TaxID=330526 RepID=A0AAE0P6W4_9PEZI|nr:hypothetical protein B0H63DRAFT_517530 [Podospora didyma]